MFKLVSHAALFGCALAALAACGGGGSGSANSGGNPIPSGGATPSGGGTPCCSPVSSTLSLNVGSQPASGALPQVNGYGGTIGLAAANATATVTVNDGTTPPSGVTAPQSSANTPLFYVTLTSDAAVTIGGSPTLTITSPAGINTAQGVYAAVLSPGGGWTTFSRGVVSGQSVTFTGIPGSVSLVGGTPLQFVVYTGPLIGANPLTVTPSPVQLLATSATQVITLSDMTLPAWFALSNSYAIASSTCSGVATVATQSPTTFVLKAVAFGTCSISITDSFGNATSVPVTVTSTTVVTQ